jgi:hypothetical protein
MPSLSLGSYISTSTVASTVIVSPSPIDSQVNSGAPFTIQINQLNTPPKAKRQVANLWIMVDGYLTADYSKAAIFSLSKGQLFADGLIESTNFGIANQIFAGSPPDSAGTITTQFSVMGGQVSWTSGLFPGGSAIFYTISGYGLSKRAASVGDAVVVKFSGPAPQEWQAISLSIGRKFRPNLFTL